MAINFNSYGEYYRSKVPLKFVLIAFVALAVNLVILSCFQLMTVFRFAGPVDSEMLGRMDSRFEGCTILDSAEDSREPFTEYHIYLVETADGETHAATLEKHFLADRYRLREEMSVPVPNAPGEQWIETENMKRSISICITDNSEITNYQAFSNFSTVNTNFLILIAMCAVELIVYGFVFKREELA